MSQNVNTATAPPSPPICDCQPDAPAGDMALVKISSGETVGVDPCIAYLVQVLNDAGYKTTSCCCGHNQRPGIITLEDGRELIIMPNWAEARRIDHLWPDTLGN